MEKIADGVWSIPVIIPDNSVRYTLCYLVVDGDERIIIDPGWDSDEGWRNLVDGLHLAGYDPTSVTGIIITHFHPDHIGMAERLRRSSSAWVGMHEIERDDLARGVDMEVAVALDNEWLARSGVPEEVARSLELTREILGWPETIAPANRLLADGDLLEFGKTTVRVVWTPGHSPGHLCLVAQPQGLLFTGDHLLPRITSGVFLISGEGADPIRDYMASVEKLRPYTELEACPAHEYRFRNIDGRLNQVIRHHELRNREILDVVEASPQPPTLWEVAQRLSWSRGWESLSDFSLRAALSETAAHIRWLTVEGLLSETDIAVLQVGGAVTS